MSDNKIDHEENSGGGRYFIVTRHGEAEMTYALESGRMIIDHTFVPPADRGGSIASSLVERAVADARARNLKIVPLCAYVASQFRRRRDWADLLAK